MADLSKTVEIIFGATDKNTKATVDSIAGSLTTFDAGIQRIAQPVANFTESLLKAEGAIAALAAAYGGYAVMQAAKFQTAQIDLNKVLSEGDPAIETFTATVTALSEQYGVSADQVLQGVANFKQAGFTAAEAAELQKNALDLVIAGDVDAARASEILISAIKGFGAEASVASRYIEAMNNVSNDYATDINQLAEGMSRVAPILKTMGFSFEEGTGLLTPMIEVFRDGGLAAEALKTGLLKLVDDAKPVTTALEALGVSQFDLNGKMRSGRDIFYDVATAFQSVDQNQKLVFAGQLFGIEQAPKLVTVFDNLAKVNEVTASALTVTGSTAKEVEMRLASAEVQIERFKVGFENLARVMGSQVLGEFTGIVGGATDIENAFRRTVEAGGLAPLFDALKPQLAEFEALLQTVARNLPDAFKGIDWSGLLDSLGELGGTFKDAFNRIFDGADISTVEGLQKTLQTTVNIITALVNVTRGIVDQFTPIFSAIGEAGKQLGESSTETQLAGGKLLGTLTILGEFGTMMGTTLFVLKESQADIGHVFDFLVGASRIFTNYLQVAFDGAALAITTFAEGTAFALGKLLSALGASDTGKQFSDMASELKYTADGISQNLESNGRDIDQAWTQMVGGLTGGSDQAARAITKVGDASQGPRDDFKSLGVDTAALVGKFAEFGFTLDPLSGKIDSIGNASGRTDEEIKKLVDTASGVGAATNKAAEGFKTLDEAQKYVAENMAGSNNAAIALEGGLWRIHDGAFGAATASTALAKTTQDAAKAGAEGSKEWKTVQDTLLATQKQADDFKIAMGDLANKRYEIDVKAAVDLQVANIEADTARINSALQATSEVIGTLTQGTTSLWETFSKKAGFTGAEEIKSAAKNMERRLDEELAVKKSFTDAIVAKLQAETYRLTSGEPLISIDARELAPELELVFDKILKYTQVKATQQGLAMLVGI